MQPTIKDRHQNEPGEDWELIFQAINDPVMVLDLNYRILAANPAIVKLTGMAADKIVGCFCYKIFNCSAHPSRKCPLERLLQATKPETIDMELEILNRTFMVSVTPVFDAQGALVKAIHIARDITKQKQIEEQLQQMQKMEAIGTLASGIAHDLNNILTPIIGNTELAILTMPPGRWQDHLDAVLVAAQRARDLVRQILTFSRKGSSIRKPLRLQPLIKSATKLLSSLLPASIEIRQNIDMACGPVLADATQIHQVIMNLCTNACHAMQEKGGILEVSLSEVKLIKDHDYQTVVLPAGDFLLLTIKDTGHGMEKEVLGRIFEPYFTTKSESEGTGMGLSVVHGIVKGHDGAIIARSEPGKGSTFQVYLPRIEAVGSEIFPGVSGREPIPLGSERILIIDDEEPIIGMMNDILTHLGYKVTSLTNSTEALELFCAQPNAFDLVITDQIMPLQSGEELTEKMLAIRPDLPTILFSGNDLSMSEKKAQAIGARKFLLKPLAMNQLAVTIREILDENPSSI